MEKTLCILRKRLFPLCFCILIYYQRPRITGLSKSDHSFLHDSLIPHDFLDRRTFNKVKQELLHRV